MTELEPLQINCPTAVNRAIISDYKLSSQRTGTRVPTSDVTPEKLVEEIPMSNLEFNFFFLQDPATDSSGTAAAAMQFVSDRAVLISSVKDMVYSVLRVVKATNGKIKSITIMGHGLDDPNGLNDPAMFIRIGADKVTAESVLTDPFLPILKSYFLPDALVRLSGCKVGTSKRLLQAFSAVLGGVKVEGWTDSIAVCDSVICYVSLYAGLHRGITYHGEQIFCTMNGCEEPEIWHEGGPGRQ